MALFHCMIRHGTAHFWGGFLVPPRLRFQVSRTVTIFSTLLITDWPERMVTSCIIEFATRYTRPVRFKLANPAKDRMQLFFERMQPFRGLLKKDRRSSH